MNKTILNYTITKEIGRDSLYIYYGANNEKNETLVLAEFAPVKMSQEDYSVLASAHKSAITARSGYKLGKEFLNIFETIFFEEKLYVVSAPTDVFALRERLSSGGVYRPALAFELILPFIKALDNANKSNRSFDSINPDNITIKDNALCLLQYEKNSAPKTIDTIIQVAELLYFMLTGRNYSETTSAPSKLGISLTPETEAVIMRALSEDETVNFRTLFEFHESLAEKLSNADKPADRSMPNILDTKTGVKTGSIAFVVGGIFLLAVILIGTLAWAITGLMDKFEATGTPEPISVIATVKELPGTELPSSELPNSELPNSEPASAAPETSEAEPGAGEPVETEDPDAYKYYTMLITDSFDSAMILNGTVAENSKYVYYKTIIGETIGIIMEEKATGEKQTILDTTLPSFIIATETKLFFNDAYQGYALIMANFDGTDAEPIITDVCFYPVIDEKTNTIYYSNYGAGELVSYSLDDGSFSVIVDDSVSELFLYGDSIYYVNMFDQCLYSINKDGSDRKQCLEDTIFRIVSSGGKLFYVSYADGLLYSYDLENETREVVVEDEYVYDFAIKDNKIYFVSEEQEFALCVYDLDSSEITVLHQDDVSYLQVINDKLYYVSDAENAVLVRCDFSGENRELLSE